MTTLTIKCKRFQFPKIPPQLHLPGFGVFKKLGTAIDEVPDGSGLIGAFLDDLSEQLAPLMGILEIVEAVMAVYNCVKALPEAILTFNIGAIFECLQNLARAIAVIFGYIPPMGYIRTAIDISGFCIDLIDEIFKLLMKIDQKITRLIATYEEAQQLLDDDLKIMSECAADEVAWIMDKVMMLVQFIKTHNDPLIKVFKRTLPGGDLKIQLGRAQSQYDEATKYLDDLKSMVDSAGSWVGIQVPDYKNLEFEPKTIHEMVPVPQLEPAMAAINEIRSACVIIYNGLAPMVGVLPDKAEVSDPVYRNF